MMHVVAAATDGFAPMLLSLLLFPLRTFNVSAAWPGSLAPTLPLLLLLSPPGIITPTGKTSPDDRENRDYV